MSFKTVLRPWNEYHTTLSKNLDYCLETCSFFLICHGQISFPQPKEFDQSGMLQAFTIEDARLNCCGIKGAPHNEDGLPEIMYLFLLDSSATGFFSLLYIFFWMDIQTQMDIFQHKTSKSVFSSFRSKSTFQLI